jgi:hypothetical protein
MDRKWGRVTEAVRANSTPQSMAPRGPAPSPRPHGRSAFRLAHSEKPIPCCAPPLYLSQSPCNDCHNCFALSESSSSEVLPHSPPPGPNRCRGLTVTVEIHRTTLEKHSHGHEILVESVIWRWRCRGQSLLSQLGGRRNRSCLAWFQTQGPCSTSICGTLFRRHPALFRQLQGQ